MRNATRAVILVVLACIAESVGAADDLAAKTAQSPRQGVILNQAADAIVGYLRTEKPLEEGATKEMVLAGLRQVVDQYAGTRVSHLVFNVCYQRAAYRSDVWESYWDVENPETDTTGWPRRYWLIHKLGIDPFAVCIARSRQKGFSPWVSVRMNDTHYIDDPHKTSRLWQEHPESRTAAGGGFDYTRPEVRRHYLALIEELLGRYDVDGIELDWMRFAHHFKPEDVEHGRGLLTEFTRKAQQLAKQAAAKRGHPVGLAARVPATPEFAHGLGMDAVAWVQERLVDVLIPCSTWNPSYPDVPVQRWREQIGPGVDGYVLAPGTDLWIRGAPGGRFMRTNMETLRGFTASMLDRGADRIYLFNHFAPVDFKLWYGTPEGNRTHEHVYHDLLGEAGSLQCALAGPRRHVLTYHDPVPPGADYRRPLPAKIESQSAVRFRIHVGPRPGAGRVLFRVGLDKLPGFEEARLEARVNGKECRAAEDLPKPNATEPPPKQGSHEVWSVAELAPRVAQSEAPSEALQRGYNTVEINVAEGAPQRLIWLEIYVAPKSGAEDGSQPRGKRN